MKTQFLKATFKYAMLTLIAVISFSCQPEQGPQGEQGPIGEQGPKGDKGDKGDNGKDGNANVYASDWFTPNSWNTSTIFEITNFEHTINDSKITQELLNSGTLIVFGKLEGYSSNIWQKGQVSQLPVNLSYKTSEGLSLDTWTALATVGKLKINFTNSINLYTSISTAHTFRYVIIPSNKASRLALDYTKMSYNELMESLELDK